MKTFVECGQLFTGNDDDAALSRGLSINGAQSHAARPHGRGVEFCAKPMRCA